MGLIDHYFGLEYFLLVAEELNISTAAQRAYISQQGMSKYIMRLENQCGIELFNRHPCLSLTPAGKLLYEQAKKAKLSFDIMSRELSTIKRGLIGQVRLGIPFGRAVGMLPWVIPEFVKRYPKVELYIETDLPTNVMRDMLEKGKLDLVICLSSEPHQKFEYLPILSESIFVAITDQLLREYLPDIYMQKQEYADQGIDLREFQKVPFITFPPSSRMNQIIGDYLDAQAITMNYVMTMNCAELHLTFCDLVACFCTPFSFCHVERYNRKRPLENKINLFPVKGMKSSNVLQIVYRKGTQLPSYLKYFIELVEQFANPNISSDIHFHSLFD